ncbi:MAG: hypothetical protein ACR2MB_13725 [Acidimicrobiales bacterium]
MTDRLDNPWRIEHVEDDAVARLALRHVANSKAVELAVDIVGTRSARTTKGSTGLGSATLARSPMSFQDQP